MLSRACASLFAIISASLLALPALAQEPPAYTSRYTAGDTPPELGTVNDVFAATYAETCAWALDGNMGAIEPNVYDFKYRYDYDEPTAPDHLFRVYEYYCDAGAYNGISVFMAWDEVSGVHALSFAEPDLDIQYNKTAGDSGDTSLKSITVTGFLTLERLINAEIDRETGTISSSSKWRGMADASSQGIYELRDQTYVLKTFDVDPTFDEEFNSIRVYDASKAEPVPLVVLGDGE